jgi:hypothetical protein
MLELSDRQFEEIESIVQSSISNRQLQLELIDHCCCYVEEQMSLGMPFEEALKRSISLLSPNGLHIIEVELNVVLQSKNLRIMKALTYFFGFIAAFFIIIGFMMRMLHWPGADYALFAGNTGLIISMFSLLVQIVIYGKGFTSTSLTRATSGAFGGFAVGAGSFFKLMHWPGANIMFVIGMCIIAFVFVPLFFWQLYRKEFAKS